MKLPITALLIGSLLLLAPPSWSQNLRVVTEDAPPYSFIQDGKIAGTATTVVERTLQVAGLQDYRIQLYPWARAYDMALTDPNVLIYMIARTAEREHKFQWAGEFMRMTYHLYRLRSRQDIAPTDVDGARRYVIGVIRDDVRQQYLQGKRFNQLVVSANPTENLAKLIHSQVDMVPLTEEEMPLLCQALRFDCSQLERVLTLHEMTTGLYMAYSKSTPAELVQRTKAAFDKLQAAGEVRRLMTPQASR